MLWFRKTSMALVFSTMLFALLIFSIIMNMCTNSSHTKSIDGDPFYNGTLGMYLLILVVQLTIIGMGIWGFCLAYKNWRNNYQMDHKMRHDYILWMCLWAGMALVQVAMAIYLIVRDKDPQGELSFLYQMFTKYNQETKLVGHFERYQRENSCCGIYGPDDWMMVSMRAGGGQPPGAANLQSLDYGFRQNPSTGQCHLTPPTIPMGCGLKMMEGIHFTMYVISGVMILETLIALTAVLFVGYCFYHWLDKEVIVIPEDEVSNLIILEAESSTATTGTESEGALNPAGYNPQGYNGYLGTGSQGPYYDPNYPEGYMPPMPLESYPGTSSRGQSSIGGSSRSSASPRPTGYISGSAPFGMYPFPPATLSNPSPGGVGMIPSGLNPTDPVVGQAVPSAIPTGLDPSPSKQTGGGLNDADLRYYGGPTQQGIQYPTSYSYQAPKAYQAEDMANLVQHVLNLAVPPRGPNLVQNLVHYPSYYPATGGYENFPRFDPGWHKSNANVPPRSHNSTSQSHYTHREFSRIPRYDCNTHSQSQGPPSERHARASSTERASSHSRGQSRESRHESRTGSQEPTPNNRSGYGHHTVDHDVPSGQHRHTSQMSAGGRSAGGHSNIPVRSHNRLEVNTRRQHGNLKKLKGKEVSLTPQGSRNGPGTRIGLHHQAQRSHHQSENGGWKRTKSRSSFPEKTEVLFKNPRSLGES